MWLGHVGRGAAPSRTRPAGRVARGWAIALRASCASWRAGHPEPQPHAQARGLRRATVKKAESGGEKKRSLPACRLESAEAGRRSVQAAWRLQGRQKSMPVAPMQPPRRSRVSKPLIATATASSKEPVPASNLCGPPASRMLEFRGSLRIDDFQPRERFGLAPSGNGRSHEALERSCLGGIEGQRSHVGFLRARVVVGVEHHGATVAPLDWPSRGPCIMDGSADRPHDCEAR